MINWLKKIINIYIIFINKKPLKTIIEALMIIWVIFILSLYCYYHNYLNALLITILLFFIPLLILKLISIFKKEKNLISLEGIKKILNIKDLYNINIKYLFLLIPILAVILTNFILLLIPIDGVSLKNLLFYEFNIIQKIFSLYIFYSLLILLIYSIGRKILSLFKFNFTSKLELFIFSVGVGFIPFMFGTFFIALLGWLYAWAIWIFILLLFIFSFKELKIILKELNDTNIQLSFANKFLTFKSLVLVGLLFLLTLNFIIITKPLPTESDSLHVYFNAPNLYVEQNKFIPITYSSHASMGQNAEMIYATIMSVFSPKYIIHLPLIYFILSLIGFYSLLKNLFNEKHAILGILLLYFIPLNYFFIYSNKTETFLIFYSLLILYALFLWYYNNLIRKFLYLMGIFSGIAFGVKYNAAFLIISVFIFAFVVIILQKRKKLPSLIKQLIISFLLMLLFFSPWAIKNQVYFNNVIYPFEYFGFKNQNSDIFNNSTYNNYIKKRGKEITYLKHSLIQNNKSVTNFIKTIWNQSIGKNILLAQGSNFGFIPLLIIPFYFLYLNKKIIITLLIPIGYFLLWYASGTGGAWYALFGFIMFFALLPFLLLKSKKILYLYLPFISIITMTSYIIFTNNINYLIGKKNTEEYAYNSVVHYGTAQYINGLNLTQNEKIIIVGDFKTAFIERSDKIIEYVEPYLRKTGYLLNSGEENFLNYLKDNSIKYIIHSRLYTVFQKWPEFHGLTLDEYKGNYQGEIPSLYEDFDKLQKFLNNNSHLIFDDGYYMLYELN